MEFLDKVKLLCKNKGISQRKMEQEIGISNGASSKWASSSPSMEIVQKLSNYFNVSINYLMTGDVEYDIMPLNRKDERDIARRLENTLTDLDTDDALMFYGEPLDEKTRELLRVSIENSMRIGKINAKQKFTPKKYRKNNE